VLVTGATGYVGGRLLHRLEERGDDITCLARTPDNLEARCAPTTRIVKGDVTTGEGLDEAMRGVDVAYFLVHAMGSADYHTAERDAAQNFLDAAERAGVGRIVYLGALGRGKHMSKHLESRQEVGRILRSGSIPAIEFRSSVIIGSGSLSFEMVRALVDRLPLMVWPKWVDTPTQPIGVEDVIEYLVQASVVPLAASEVVDIGGSDQVSYGSLLTGYGRARGLRRFFIRVPVLTPRLSSLWLGLVTPVYARVGRELVEGLRAETVVTNDTARRLFPSITPMGMDDQIARALANEDREFAVTRWSDAVSSRGQSPMRWGGARKGARLVDARSAFVPVPPEVAFAPIQRIGGDAGWYHADFLWDVRGFLDLPFGGAGQRRGRRDPEQLVVGDTVDFWRVEEIAPGNLLRMQAEMALPGRAWLQFEVREVPSGTMIHQTALFDPMGVFGRLYWYAMWPFHQFVFGGTLRSICRLARAEERGREKVPA
jgi:uncharacterized protein YbjT (DUF2867 family)